MSLSRGHYRVRSDTLLNWETKNPVLGSGEWGFAYDARVLKIGDGVKRWNELLKSNKR